MKDRNKKEKRLVKDIIQKMEGLENTNKKVPQQNLEEANRFLNHILESSSTISIIATDRDRTIEYWNSGAENMFGYRPSEVLGNHKIDLLYPHDNEETREIIEEARTNALNKKKGRSCEVIERRKDGKNIWVRLTITPRCDDKGYVNSILGIGQDITEQRQAEIDRKQSMDKLRKAIGGIVTAMSRAVETRDPYTAGHQRRATDLARAIAKEMTLEKDRIEAIRLAGSIHDLGKLYVPAEILNKPGTLDEHEIGLIQKHVEAGYEIVKHIDFPWPIADIILQHHERMDGSGYPKGLSGKDIHIEARILAVADVVESMSSHRPYRPALGLDKALEEISKNRDIFYDADAVNCCLRLFKEKGFQLKSCR